MEDLKSKFIKSAMWVGSAKFVGQAFSWAVTIFLVRILSPQDFGIIGMAAAYEAIVIIVYDLNLGAALVQKQELSRREVQTTFWAILVLGILFYALTILLAPFVAGFFQNDKVEKVLIVYALGAVVQSFQQVPYWLLSKRLDFDKRAKAEIISSVCSVTASLVLAILGFGVWSLVFGFLVKNCIQALVVSYYFAWGEYFSWSQFFTFSPHALRMLLKFSFPLTGFYLLRYIFMRSDSIIVGRCLGSEALGYYSVALDLARIPVTKFVLVLNQVCIPVFCELQKDVNKLKTYFFKIIGFVSLIIFPVCIGAAIVSREMVLLVLTEKWEPIILPFVCLCFLAILQSLAGINFMLLNALGESRVNLKFSVMAAIALPLSFLVGIRYGIMGIVLSWLVVYPFLFLYLCCCVGKYVGADLEHFLDSVRVPVVGTLIMSIAVLTCKMLIGFYSTSVAGFVLYIVIGAITYAGYIFLFSSESVGDIKGIYRELFSKRATSTTTSK